MTSEIEAEKSTVFEKLRFLESPSIKYSYITLYALGGLILTMSVVFAFLDLSNTQVLQAFQYYRGIGNILIFVLYYGVILALVLNFLKISTWYRWNKPIPIIRNIVKAGTFLASTVVFVVGTIDVFYWEINILKTINSNPWEIEILFPEFNVYLHIALIRTFGIMIFIFAGLLVMDMIMEIIHKREISKIDYRAAVLLLALAIVYTNGYYQIFISAKIANSNAVIFVNGLIISLLYIINGTMFLLVDRKWNKKGKEIMVSSGEQEL